MGETITTKGIDKTHGFMQEIINNQFDRKSYDLEGDVNKETERLRKVEFYNQKLKEERRIKREKIPTRQTYIPPSQRKSQITPPRFLGRTVFQMEVEFSENKFAPIKIRESESIKKACELFVDRHDMNTGVVADLEAHISLHMGLASLT